MKLAFLLLLALAASVALIVFPNIADQSLRIEAFGWVFETRQGAFLAAMFALFFTLWFLRGVLGAIFAGPGAAWRSLRMGSRKRRANKLKELLGQWLDGRGNISAKALKRCQGVLPDWAMELLQTTATSISELPLPSEDQDPLVTVLTARLVTDPLASSTVDLPTRKAHLDAWLQAHSGAPLAMSRRVDLAEEEGDLLEFISRLEAEWKQGRQPAELAKPRLVHACLAHAKAQPDDAMAMLRKAYRLLPDDPKVIRAYGQALLDSGDMKGGQRLWAGYLEQHSNDRIARSLLELQRPEAMQFYRKLEKKKAADLNHAQRWLRAELAHAAKLDGLAFEHMQALADDSASIAAWNSLGHWYEATQDYEKSASCYRQALEKTDPR